MSNLTSSDYTNRPKRNHKKIIYLLMVLTLGISLVKCNSKPPANANGCIMALSISSDGKYVISSSLSQHIVLWDIPHKTYKIIARHANIYSAYFIKNTDDFMYQSNRNNTVYVMNVAGETLKTIKPGFPTYGQILSRDLSNYFAVNVHNDVFNIRDGVKRQLLYSYCGPNYQTTPPPKGMPYTCFDFPGIGKLFNLTLSTNENFFVTSGDDEYYLWNARRASLIEDTVKDDGQTFATISPDDKYIISGDLQNEGYLYNTFTGKGIRFDYNFPDYPIMKRYENYDDNDGVSEITTVKYIDNDHVLVFIGGDYSAFNYATLYKVELKPEAKPSTYYQMTPIKYLPLIPNAQSLTPMTDAWERDQAIDTAPNVHVLVVAQEYNNGILVYHYDLTTQSLKQIWSKVIE